MSMTHKRNALARTIVAGISCLGLMIGMVQLPSTAAAAESNPGFSSRGVPLNGQTLLGSCSSCTSSSQDPAAGEAKFGGQKYGIHRTYYQGNQQSAAVNRAKEDLAGGRVPWMSFKLPNGYGFRDMAAGKGDAWARDLARRLGGVGGPVWVAIHHEPENDRDQSLKDWTAMQRHLSPIFRAHSNIAFSVILMGYHQFTAPKINPELSMDALWPGQEYVDVTGFDPYNNYGTVKYEGGPANTNFTELKVYYEKIAAWSAANGGAKWAVAETGFTDAASAKDVKWLSRSYDDMKAAGGVALAYWDCTKKGSPNSFDLTTKAEKNEFAALLARSDTLGTRSGGAAPSPAPTTPIAFRTAAKAYANATSLSVSVPGTVKAGDSLLLFAAGNRSDVALSGPGSGWSSLDKTTDGTLQTQAWSRVATAADAGSNVTVSASAQTKLNLQLVAYSGTDAENPVASVVAVPETSIATVKHTTPLGAAVPTGGWVISHWAEKVTGAGGWTPPAGHIEREESLSSGGGAVNTMTADAGQPSTGAAGGHQAVSTTPAAKATMLTIVLRAA